MEAIADQSFWAKRGEREAHRRVDGRLTHRVPSSLIHLVGFNGCGWFGWDPVNERWVSAPFGLPFAYHWKLREALEFIDWFRGISDRETVDWPRLYPFYAHIGILSPSDRVKLMDRLEFISSKRKA